MLHISKIKIFPGFVFLLLGLVSQSIAQNTGKNDVILKRDSTQIQALILQMTYEKINYRDLGSKDSAKTYISMDKVSRIFLKNGRIINVKDSIPAVVLPPDSIGQYADMSNLPQNAFDKSVVIANSDQLRDKYKYHHDRSLDGKTGAIVFTSFGVASLVAGLVVAGNGSTDNKKFGTSLAIAGPVVGGVLGLIGYRNWKLHGRKAEKIKSELSRRNQSLGSVEFSPNYDFLNKSAGLSLRMKF